MTKPEKNYDTGIRILEILKILLEKDVSKQELIEKIKNNPLFESVYTNEAFIKYFNTLEILGIEMNKNKKVYSIKKALSCVQLSKEEKEVFVELISYIEKLHDKDIENSLKEAFSRILKFLEMDEKIEIEDILNRSNNNCIYTKDNFMSSLESFLAEKQQISISYKKNETIIDSCVVELKEIIEKNGEVILVCYDASKGRNKKILASSVVSIKQLPRKISNKEYLNTVVFRLRGRLASSYKLKKSEKLVDFSSDCITISNAAEDKDVLLRRILKYGENCEIIQPKSAREDFVIMTENILKNLQESA